MGPGYLTGRCAMATGQLPKDVFRLVMQDYIEQGPVHAQSAVVLNKPEPPKLIEKETDARTRGADHFGQRFLTDLRNGGLGLFVFAEVRQE
jgi:hypothetical protein